MSATAGSRMTHSGWVPAKVNLAVACRKSSLTITGIETLTMLTDELKTNVEL